MTPRRGGSLSRPRRLPSDHWSSNRSPAAGRSPRDYIANTAPCRLVGADPQVASLNPKGIHRRRISARQMHLCTDHFPKKTENLVDIPYLIGEHSVRHGLFSVPAPPSNAFGLRSAGFFVRLAKCGPAAYTPVAVCPIGAGARGTDSEEARAPCARTMAVSPSRTVYSRPLSAASAAARALSSLPPFSWPACPSTLPPPAWPTTPSATTSSTLARRCRSGGTSTWTSSAPTTIWSWWCRARTGSR